MNNKDDFEYNSGTMIEHDTGTMIEHDVIDTGTMIIKNTEPDE